jgi:hypothetical protein
MKRTKTVRQTAWAVFYPKYEELEARAFRTRRALVADHDGPCGKGLWRRNRRSGWVKAVRVEIVARVEVAARPSRRPEQSRGKD